MSNNTLQFSSASLDDTARLGRAIGQAIDSGLLITLQGTLGAGKTNLVQSIADGLQVNHSAVVSPTFTLIQVHQGRLPLVHIDAYRIADEDQYLELGIDEFFDNKHVVTMEWAEKFVKLLPEERLAIRIEVTGDQHREFHFEWPVECDAAVAVANAVRGL